MNTNTSACASLPSMGRDEGGVMQRAERYRTTKPCFFRCV